MALNSFGLGIVFTASDLASNVIRGLSKSFMGLDNTANKALDSIAKKVGVSTDAMTKGLKGMAGGLAVAATGFLGLKGAFAVTDLAAKFEFKMAGIQAISGATGKELKLLEKAAIDAGIATQFSPLEAAEGLQILAQAGFKTKQSIETLLPVLDLAAASLDQLGLEESGGVTIAAMKVFPEAAADATLAVDNLVRSTSRSSLQFRELPLALGIAARGAKIFQASMEDTLIALGEVRNVIPTVERGATSVATAMELLATPKVQKQLKDLGVEVKTLDGKNFRPFLNAMADTSKAFKAMDGDAIRGEKLLKIFGRRGVSGLAPLLDAISTRAIKAGGGIADYTKAVAEMRGEMRNANITAENFRKKLNATFKGLKTLLQGTIDTIIISVGLPFAQALKPVVDKLTRSLNFLLRGFMDLPSGIKVAVAQFLILASAIALIFGVVTALVAMKGVLFAIGAAAAVVLAPFFKVLAVIALVAGAAMLLKAAWDANTGGIRDALLPVLQKVSMFFRGLFEMISKGKITGELAKQLGDSKNSGILDFITAFAKGFAFVKQVAMGIFDAFKEAFDRVVGAASPIFFQLKKTAMLFFGLLLKFGKIFGKMFGLDMTKDGITSVKTFANVITAFLIEPLVFGFEVVLTTISALLAILNAVLEVANFLAKPFIAVADLIGGAFKSVFFLLTGNFVGFFGVVTRGINNIIGMLNSVISAAQKVAFGLAPNAAAANSAVLSLEKLKLREFKTQEVAFAFGAGDKTIQDIVASEKAPRGTKVPPRASAPPDSSGTNAGAIPQSVPTSTRNAQAGGVMTALDIRNVIEAAARSGFQSADGRPIVVQGTVTLDGEALGTMQAQQSRDNRAGRGLIAPSLRDE